LIVLDASAVAEVVLRRPRAEGVAAAMFATGESLHAPHFLALEVTHVIRRVTAAREISLAEALVAVASVEALSIARYAHEGLLGRIWGYRHNFSVYDAAYVVLAEVLGARLLTLDMRLAAAVRDHTAVELV